MTINSTKSKIFQFGRTKEDVMIFYNKEVIGEISDFRYLDTIINRFWKWDSELTNCITGANSVNDHIYNAIIGNRGVG